MLLKASGLFQLPRIFLVISFKKGASSSEGSVGPKHFLASLEDLGRRQVRTSRCMDLGESHPSPSSVPQATERVRCCPCKECKCQFFETRENHYTAHIFKGSPHSETTESRSGLPTASLCQAQVPPSPLTSPSPQDLIFHKASAGRTTPPLARWSPGHRHQARPCRRH